MTMPYTCDSLLPVEDRFASMKYRRLSRWFNPYRQFPEDLLEVRALMLTPGLLRCHVEALMLWNRNMRGQLKPLEQLDGDPFLQAMVHANAVGVDQHDGEMMLRAILGNFPKWSRSVPLWSTRYLQERRRMGASVKGLAHEFGVGVDHIGKWWKADLFDPLTACARRTRSSRRVLGI